MKQYSILSEKRYQYVLTLIFSSTTQMQIFHLGNQSLLLKAQRHAIVLFEGVRCLFPCLDDSSRKIYYVTPTRGARCVHFAKRIKTPIFFAESMRMLFNAG